MTEEKEVFDKLENNGHPMDKTETEIGFDQDFSTSEISSHEEKVEAKVEEEPKAEEEKKKEFWKDLLQTIVLALVIFFLLNTLTSRVKVFNVSMQPTLKQGYLLLVNKMAYKWGRPKHGDIIIFHHAGIENQDYIKRVIGLPGDTVEISGGVVHVNGVPLTEPYIKEMPRYTLTEVVPENKLFVLGDNRNQSDDSHSWGFVDMEWVVGKALFIYWPLNEIRLLTGPDILKNGAQSAIDLNLSPKVLALP